MKDILISLCGRGGSKGIKNKNIRPLCGVPLIAWTLFDALRAFERREDVRKTIVVDSDSEAILETARQCSPNVLLHKRRYELAGDAVAKMDVLSEVLADTSKETGRGFDALIDLDITSPLRTFEDVEGAFALFEREVCDVTFSVVPARRNPYFNMVEIDGAGRGALCKPSEFVARQQAPRVYDMNASIYVYNPEVFRKGVRSPTRLDFRVYEMHDYGVIDIDSEEDLRNMELLLGQGEDQLSEELQKKKNEVYIAYKNHEKISLKSHYNSDLRINNQEITKNNVDFILNKTSLNKELLVKYIDNQLNNNFSKDISITPYFDDALQQAMWCFHFSKNKYYYNKKNELSFSPLNSCQYAIFLYYLSNTIFRNEGASPLADSVYYLNKMLNSVDWYYEIQLPEYWEVEHPIGSVLGRAKYSNGLFLYQGTTIGGNKGHYPIIGKNVILYMNSAILGKCIVGENVLVAAGAIIKDANIPDNCIVFGQSPHLNIIKKQDCYFENIIKKIWK